MIPYPYKCKMRLFDGSIIDAEWFLLPEDQYTTLQFDHPFGSSMFDPTSTYFDFGSVGEIPAQRPPRSSVTIPDWVCHECWCGSVEYWQDGWPSGTPPLPTRDGWPTCCDRPPMTVASVGLALPADTFVITHSPVTFMGTLTGAFVPQSANTFHRGPDTGADDVPFWGPIVAEDVPGLPATILISGLVDTARLGSGTADATTVLYGDQVWRAPPSGGIGSVALVMPAGFAVAGSPLTSSGTLTVTLTSEPATFAFMGPVSGADAPPTFRGIEATDLPDIDVDTGTTGSLPLSRTTGVLPAGQVGAIDVNTGTTGSLPLSRTTGVLPAGQVGAIDVNTGTTGTLPLSRTTGVLPAGQVGAIDVDTGTTGSLPLSRTSGTMDVGTRTTGNLPGSRLSGAGTIPGNLIISIDGATQIINIIPSANLPVGIPIAGTVGQFLQWISTTYHHTDFNTSGTSNTKTLITLPAFGTVHAIAFKTTVAFVGTGIFPSLGFGYSSGGGGTPSSTTRYGSALTISSTTNLAQYQTTQMPETQNEVGSWNLTATVSTGAGNLNTLSAGTLIVDVLVSVRH